MVRDEAGVWSLVGIVSTGAPPSTPTSRVLDPRLGPHLPFHQALRSAASPPSSTTTSAGDPGHQVAV